MAEAAHSGYSIPMPRMNGIRKVAGVLGLVVAVGCATLQRVRFDPPTVELTEVAVTGLGLSGGSLELLLDVYNPNAYTLRTTGVQTTLTLEETQFGDARLDRPLEIAGRSRVAVRVPMTFTWEGVGAGARALISRGSVRYRLGGQLFADTPIGSRTVQLAGGGTVTVRDLVRR